MNLSKPVIWCIGCYHTRSADLYNPRYRNSLGQLPMKSSSIWGVVLPCCWLITERSNKDSIKLKECLIVCKPKRGVAHSRLNCNGLHSKMLFFSLPQAHFVKCLIRVTSARPWASAEYRNHIFSQYTLSCLTAADTSVPSKLVYPDGNSPDKKSWKGHDGNPLTTTSVVVPVYDGGLCWK